MARARDGDDAAFTRLVAPLRRELHAHCYRMLGSVHDTDDALQEALLRAWRGLARFEGRSSLRTWLYTVATRACLDLVATRARALSADSQLSQYLQKSYTQSDASRGVGRQILESPDDPPTRRGRA